MRITPVIAILLLLCRVGVCTESQPPSPSSGISIHKKNESANQTTQKRTYKQPGTEEMPLVIKGFPPADSENDAAHKKYEQQEKPTLDRWLTWGTVALAIFTFFLFCFTAALWWVTYRLSKDARRTAEIQARDTQTSFAIAKESADLAKASFDSYQMAERAWVYSTGIDVSEFIDATDLTRPGKKFSGVMFHARWQNAGKTPATHCRANINSAIVPASLENIPIFERATDPEQKESALLPGIPVSTTPRYVDNADLKRLVNREVRLFVYSTFEYTDVFITNELRLSEICLEVTCNGYEPNSSLPKFFFIPTGPQNSAT